MLKITPKSHTDHSILTYEEWKIPQARLEDYKNDGTSEFLGYVLEDGTIAIADRDYKEHKWEDVDGNIYDSYFPLETTEPTYRKSSSDFLVKGFTSVNLDDNAKTSHLEFYNTEIGDNNYEVENTTHRTHLEMYFSEYMKINKNIELFLGDRVGEIEYRDTTLQGGIILSARNFDGTGTQTIGIITDNYGVIDFNDKDLKSFFIKNNQFDVASYLEANPNSLTLKDYVITHSQDGNTKMDMYLATNYQMAREIVAELTNNTKEVDTIDELLNNLELKKEIEETRDEVSVFEIPFAVTNDKKQRDLILDDKEKREEVLLEQMDIEYPFWKENDILKARLTTALEEFFMLNNIKTDNDYIDFFMDESCDFKKIKNEYKDIFPEMYFPDENSLLPHDSQTIMFFGASTDCPYLEYDKQLILDGIAKNEAHSASEAPYSAGIDVDFIQNLIYDGKTQAYSNELIPNDVFYFSLLNKVSEEQNLILKNIIKTHNFSESEAEALYKNIHSYGTNNEYFESEVNKFLKTDYPKSCYKAQYEINTPMVEERILEILSKDKEMYEKSAVIGKFESIVNDFAKEILSESQEETQSHTRRKR